MATVQELIRTEADGSISFGDYTLNTKEKVEDFESNGDLYKVKTYHEMTKLERNGMFVYESEPGTAVEHLALDDTSVEFTVSGNQDAQITVQMEEDAEYDVFVDDYGVGSMKTNRGGKLSFSVELSEGIPAQVRILRR